MTRAAPAGGGALEPFVTSLERSYGRPSPPPARGPFEMVLWENIAYLQPEDRHEAAFRELRKRVGTTPERILAASEGTLLDVAKLGGMFPERRAEKLRAIAGLAIDEFDSDLSRALQGPPGAAVRALRKFPGIGAPGAEKILLLTGVRPILALDSNGLRVLLRLGFGRQKKSYALTYRAAQEAAMASLPPRRREDSGWLGRAHLLLRRHGKELCKLSAPRCEACPLVRNCRYGRGGGPEKRSE